MSEAINTLDKPSPIEGEWFERLYSALRNIIQREEGVVSNDADLCCRSLAGAFGSYNLTDFAVDYGGTYKGLSLFVCLDNDLEFDCRVEVGSPEQTFSFFIRKNNEPFYGNVDTLDGFGPHVTNYLRQVQEYNILNSEESVD
ncbi:MAG: hypothetical protein LUD72_07455 [Bacteroidales bacterium]|nr:hypothetical protein [Bacteroidales bacterium]